VKEINIIIWIILIFTGCTSINPSKESYNIPKIRMECAAKGKGWEVKIFPDGSGLCIYVEKYEIFIDNNLTEGFYIQKIPDINSIATAEIGENMYQKINVYKTKKYSVKFIDLSYNDKFSKMDMALRKDNNKHNTICSNKICLIDTSNDYYFDTIINLSKHSKQNLDSPIAYKYKQKLLLNEDSFKYVALYQGKIGNKIKISYREFIENMSRPAFTQNINYELNKNKTTIIGFKGLRIEILKATNFNITYRVIHDYNW